MAYLEIRTGPRAGSFSEIRGDRLTIGRDVTADLRIDDGRASRRHCDLLRSGDAWRLKDLGSSNGTLLAGQRVEGEADLFAGAEIRIGSTVFVFHLEPPTGAIASAFGISAASPAAPAEPAGLNTLVAERATLISGSGAAAAGEKALADLRCLFEVARACSGARTPEAVLSALGQSLGARLKADRLYVFLGPADSGAAWSAADGAYAPDLEKVPASTTVVERARRENVAVLLADPSAEPELAAAKSIVLQKIVTALAAPLFAAGRVVGVIYADRLGRAEPFTSADLELSAAAALLAAGSLAGAEELSRARRELARLADELGAGEMLGDSVPMREVRRLLAQAAPTEAPVLVTGESGTGKELAARAIHAASHRADGPFEVVNCAALAESLIESELFGHTKGAFTGAASERVGRFELADGGTLFLDEIGELSAGAQAKLLRVLENGELSRVGESRVRKVDVRVIAATNRDLEAEVREKRFRQDLFYRLNVLRVELPPLRERGADAGLLLDRFLALAVRRLGRPGVELDEDARRRLLAYRWPGNVREMINLIERLVILSPAGEIGPQELPPEVLGGPMILPPTSAGFPAASDGPAPAVVGAPKTLDDITRAHILAVLDMVDGNKSKAAEVLGIDRSTLYARLKEYGRG